MLRRSPCLPAPTGERRGVRNRIARNLLYDSFSWVADPGDLMAMKVSALTFTWLERRQGAFVRFEACLHLAEGKIFMEGGGNVPVVLIALPGG